VIEAIDKISSEKMILHYNDRKLVHTGIRYIYLAQLLLPRPLLIKGADPVAGQNENAFVIFKHTQEDGYQTIST
jgi:hypothetical protein